MTDKKTKSLNIKDIDPELLKRARIMSIEREESLNKILKELLEEEVQDYEKESKLKK